MSLALVNMSHRPPVTKAASKSNNVNLDYTKKSLLAILAKAATIGGLIDEFNKRKLISSYFDNRS